MIIIDRFRKTKSIVSLLNYHIVFCTRYRRKLFNNQELSKRVIKLIEDKCKELNVKIISLELCEFYVYLFVECPPIISPNQLVYRIKVHCNISMLGDFPEVENIPNLWTRRCLISTEKLEQSIINKYVFSQKSRD